MLIRQMNKRSATPAPINLITKLVTHVRVALRNNMNMFTHKAQEDLRNEENQESFSMEISNMDLIEAAGVGDDGKIIEE